MKKFLIKYQAIIGFIFGVLTTLAATTQTVVDDKVVFAAQDAYNSYISETTITTTTKTTSPTNVDFELISPTTDVK